MSLHKHHLLQVREQIDFFQEGSEAPPALDGGSGRHGSSAHRPGRCCQPAPQPPPAVGSYIKCPPKPRNPCAFDYEPGSQAHPPAPAAPRGPPVRAPEPRGQLARATELQHFGRVSFARWFRMLPGAGPGAGVPGPDRLPFPAQRRTGTRADGWWPPPQHD